MLIEHSGIGGVMSQRTCGNMCVFYDTHVRMHHSLHRLAEHVCTWMIRSSMPIRYGVFCIMWNKCCMWSRMQLVQDYVHECMES